MATLNDAIHKSRPDDALRSTWATSQAPQPSWQVFETPDRVSPKTVTINAAFLREIKEDNHELSVQLAELHDGFQRPIEQSECRALIDRLYPLLDVLALHFALEEAYGYFDEPLEVAVPFSAKAHQLRIEHRELYQTLLALTDWAETLLLDEGEPEGASCLLQAKLGPRFLDFERRLRRHELEEHALICETSTTGLAAGH